jgi:hypothetical protein
MKRAKATGTLTRRVKLQTLEPDPLAALKNKPNQPLAVTLDRILA